MKIISYAKLNLTLEILGKRDDGYHLLTGVMQSISLSDTITVNRTHQPGVRLTVNGGAPANDSNTMVKAARILIDACSLPGGLELELDKTIPSQAGMGGGSSNGAAVLLAVDRLYDLHLPYEKLVTYALGIGADVPFFLRGGTQLAEGVGERLTALPPMPSCYIVLVKPPFGISTAECFTLADRGFMACCITDVSSAVEALRQGSLEGLSQSLFNRLEEPAFLLQPSLQQIRNALLGRGALGALMTGSGSTVFGLFHDLEQAEAAAASMKLYGWTHVAVPVDRGVCFEP